MMTMLLLLHGGTPHGERKTEKKTVANHHHDNRYGRHTAQFALSGLLLCIVLDSESCAYRTTDLARGRHLSIVVVAHHLDCGRNHRDTGWTDANIAFIVEVHGPK